MPPAQFKIAWTDLHRDPKVAPDPSFPKGIDIDITAGQRPACRTPLGYPAPRCGYYTVTCARCGLTVSLTTAGRADDPRSVRVACKLRPALI